MKKKLLLLCCFCLLQTTFSQIVPPQENWLVRNITADKLGPQSYAVPTQFGTACIYDSHEFTLVPPNSSPEVVEFDVIFTFTATSGAQNIVNYSYPSILTFQFIEGGTYEMVISTPFVGAVFHIEVFDTNPIITASPGSTIYQGQELNLSTNITNLNNIIWYLDDGSLNSGAEINHLYGEAGVYEVALNTSFQDQDGTTSCTGNATKTITVLENAPTIEYEGACIDQFAQLTASSPYEPAVASWQWLINGYTYYGQTADVYISSINFDIDASVTTFDSQGNVIATTTTSFQSMATSVPTPIVTGNFNNCDNQTYSYANFSPSYGENNVAWYVNGGQIISESPQSIEIDWTEGVINQSLTLTLTLEDPNSGLKCSATLYKTITNCCIQDVDYVMNDGQNIEDLIALNGSPILNNKSIVIYGDFYPSNVVQNLVANNCHFYMASESKILISSNSNSTYAFDVTNSEFESCGDTMWQGLFLRDGRINLENCVISDAIRVIDARGATTVDISPQYFRLKNNTFENNFEHLNVEYHIDDNSTITGNQFTTSDLFLKYPYAERVSASNAIRVRYVPELNIGEMQEEPNVIERADFGIYNRFSEINVRNNIIKNLPGYLPDTYGVQQFVGTAIFCYSVDYMPVSSVIEHNQILNNIIGIDAHRTSLYARENYLEGNYTGVRSSYLNNRTVIVEKNQFYRNTLGINTFVTGGGIIRYRYNKFDLGYTAISLHAAPFLGPPLSSSASSLVSRNCIYDHTGAGIYTRGLVNNTISRNFIHSMWGTGISLVESPKTNVTSNAIYGQGSNVSISAGLHATFSALSVIRYNLVRNANRGMQFTKNNNGTVLQNNMLRNTKYGIYLFNDGIIGPQGNQNIVSDNHWYGDYYDPDRYHLFANNSDGEQSPFYHRNGSPFHPYKSGNMGSFSTQIPAIGVYYPNNNPNTSFNFAQPNDCNPPLQLELV